ncbi:hypothetical protein OfM2_12720 [Lactovum odontotermitis]
MLSFVLFRGNIYFPSEEKTISISNPEKQLFYVVVNKKESKNLSVQVYDKEKQLRPQNIYHSVGESIPDGSPSGYFYYYRNVNSEMTVHIKNRTNHIIITNVSEWFSHGDGWTKIK